MSYYILFKLVSIPNIISEQKLMTYFKFIKIHVCILLKFEFELEKKIRPDKTSKKLSCLYHLQLVELIIVQLVQILSLKINHAY